MIIPWWWGPWSPEERLPMISQLEWQSKNSTHRVCATNTDTASSYTNISWKQVRWLWLGTQVQAHRPSMNFKSTKANNSNKKTSIINLVMLKPKECLEYLFSTVLTALYTHACTRTQDFLVVLLCFVLLFKIQHFFQLLVKTRSLPERVQIRGLVLWLLGFQP